MAVEPEAAIPDSFDDFNRRFWELAIEAEKHGIDTVIIMVEDDPILRTELKAVNWRCGPLKALGMTEYAKQRFAQGLGDTNE